MQVLMNTGSGEIDLGTQQLMSVPYALHSNGINLNVSATGDTLTIGGSSIVVPGISAANVVHGCTDNTACNYNGLANQNDNSCLFIGAACDDGNSNTMNDVIDGNCQCNGVLIISGCTNPQSCNFNLTANVDDGTCLIQGATCDDGNTNTINDVIDENCLCNGTTLINGLYIQGNGVTDIDGNFYPSIIINGHEWMQQNLKVSHFKNGDAIPFIENQLEWQNYSGPCYAYIQYYPYPQTVWGMMYSHYTVRDTRGICPVGWHVSTSDEWSSLITFLGGNSVAGGKLKSVSSGWNSPNIGATDLIGFSARGEGMIGGSTGSHAQYFTTGSWWTNSVFDGANDYWYSYVIHNYSQSIGPFYYDGGMDGKSVRCLKD